MNDRMSNSKAMFCGYGLKKLYLFNKNFKEIYIKKTYMCVLLNPLIRKRNIASKSISILFKVTFLGQKNILEKCLEYKYLEIPLIVGNK